MEGKEWKLEEGNLNEKREKEKRVTQETKEEKRQNRHGRKRRRKVFTGDNNEENLKEKEGKGRENKQ